MTIRDLPIEGLPADVIVRSSTRRRKTISASREAGVTVVLVPAGLSTRRVREAVSELLDRLDRARPRAAKTDALLHARAEQLRAQYLPEAPQPLRVVWSTRQHRRWGSCTPADRAIRLSAHLRDMPDYVIDAVLVHELAHLVHAGHGPEFQALLGRYPQLDRASAFLAGYSHAREYGTAGAAGPGALRDAGPPWVDVEESDAPRLTDDSATPLVLPTGELASTTSALIAGGRLPGQQAGS